MATIETQPQPRVAPAVHTALDGLRRQIRRYVWLEGLGAAIAWLGLAFWLSLALDWVFEPSVVTRATLLAAVGIVLAGVLVQWIGRRAFVSLTDSNMATVLERHFPQLEDSVLTSVVLTGRRPDEAGYSPQMLFHTCREAEERIAAVSLPHVFNPAPLRRNMTLALLLAAAVVLFAIALPEAFGTWARRSLLFSNELWPRRVRFQVVGFHDGVAKVASGADFDVVVQAFQGDTDEPVLPPPVEIRYRVEGGQRGRQTMERRGAGRPEENVLQEYGYTFRGVLAPVRFDVVGGDAALRGLEIQVVPNPTATQVVEYDYPAYMERPRRTMPVTGVMQVPVGTRVTVRAQANKELEWVQIDTPADADAAFVVPASAGGAPEPPKGGTTKLGGTTKHRPPKLLKGKDLSDDRTQFSYALEPVDRDTTLLFTLKDTDGIKSREPVRLALVAVPDEAPQVAARLAGLVVPAVTPQGRLPVVGRVTDDYGIGAVWFEHEVEKQKPGTIQIATPAKHPSELPLTDVGLEIRDLKLAKGQKLSVRVKASDLCNLGKGPNVGASESWMLEVVAPDELRAMLEARELVLRQRFEAIIQEVTDTRDLLLKMEPEWPGKAKPAANGKTTSRFVVPALAGSLDGIVAPALVGSLPEDRLKAALQNTTALQDSPFTAEAAPVQPARPGGAEPGDEPTAPTLSPAEQLTRRTERVLQALQNGRKNAQETLGVAESFDDIRQQFVNNRLDSDELRSRLGRGIAEPLYQIAQVGFPELDRRLEALQAAVADLDKGPAKCIAARQQADKILLEMQAVLSRMAEMGDFNEEVLARIRKMIETQEQIIEETKVRQKEGIRNLLEK